MNIYLDMDDVVADWMGYARDYLKVPVFKDGDRLPDATWRRLKDDQRMYSKLPIKEGAEDLVNFVLDYKDETGCGVYFLSAIPKGNDMPWAVQDKVFWAQRHFPHIPVFLGPYSHEKHMHCREPGDILIDDRTSNCEEWIAAGGHAHIYRTWPNCKVWLEQVLSLRS